MKMMLLDVEQKTIRLVEANGLDDYYEYLNCRAIDIVMRKIGDRYFNIICDDEGLLKDKPQPSGIDVTGFPMLYGNLLIAGEEVIEGELTSLKLEEIEHLMCYTAEITTSMYKKPYPVFVEMDY